MVPLLYWIAELELETIKVEIADFPFFSHQLIVHSSVLGKILIHFNPTWPDWICIFFAERNIGTKLWSTTTMYSTEHWPNLV